MQIGSLICRPLCWGDTSAQTQHFRLGLTRGLDQYQSVKFEKITRAVVTNFSTEQLKSIVFAEKFTVRFCYYDTLAEDVVECDLETEIFEAVRRLLQKDKDDFKIEDGYIVESFVVKIMGNSEFILENELIAKFRSPLGDLKCKREPCFVLIPARSTTAKLKQFFAQEKVTNSLLIFIYQQILFLLS